MAASGAGGFGSRLRQARERRGISIRQIATATKLGVGPLEALERNDISRLPGGIFSRSIVRAYAIEVGLDPEATIQEFVTQFPHDSVTAGHPASTSAVDAEDNAVIEGERRSASVFLWMFLVSVPVAGALLYFSTAGRPGEPPAAPDVAQRASVQAPTPVPAVQSLLIDVTVAAPTMVTAVADGRSQLNRRMAAGEHQTFQIQHDMVLTVDDPSAIVLKLNGADAKVPGAAGRAAVLTLTPANYRDYLTVR